MHCSVENFSKGWAAHSLLSRDAITVGSGEDSTSRRYDEKFREQEVRWSVRYLN